MMAEVMVKGEKYETNKKLAPFEANIREILKQVRADYPEDASSEQKIKMPLDKQDTESVRYAVEGSLDAVKSSAGGFVIFFSRGYGLDANRLVVLFFLSLKTLADLHAHQKKHAAPFPQGGIASGN